MSIDKSTCIHTCHRMHSYIHTYMVIDDSFPPEKQRNRILSERPIIAMTPHTLVHVFVTLFYTGGTYIHNTYIHTLAKHCMVGYGKFIYIDENASSSLCRPQKKYTVAFNISKAANNVMRTNEIDWQRYRFVFWCLRRLDAAISYPRYSVLLEFIHAIAVCMYVCVRLWVIVMNENLCVYPTYEMVESNVCGDLAIDWMATENSDSTFLARRESSSPLLTSIYACMYVCMYVFINVQPEEY